MPYTLWTLVSIMAVNYFNIHFSHLLTAAFPVNGNEYNIDSVAMLGCPQNAAISTHSLDLEHFLHCVSRHCVEE